MQVTSVGLSLFNCRDDARSDKHKIHNYLPQLYLYIKYKPLHVSTFPCHHQGVLRFCLAKLHKFLKFKLLNLQSLNCINILFNLCLVTH